MSPSIQNPQSEIENCYKLSRLRSALTPFRLHWFPRLRSTNDHAAAMRRRGDLYAPSLVLTGHQTAGRGRGDHVWWSGPGCITVTFVLPPDDRIAPHQLPLLAGLAVRSAAEELTSNVPLARDARPDPPVRSLQRAIPRASAAARLQLKWPNDLLVNEAGNLRKVAGLLCERIDGADFVGLGLNVNLDPSSAPAGLRDRVASLSQIAGRTLDLTDALATVARHLRRVMAEQQEKPFAVALSEYHEHHALVGRTISVIGAGDAGTLTGRCEGLDDAGRLLLRSRGTLHRIISGQVVLTGQTP